MASVLPLFGSLSENDSGMIFGKMRHSALIPAVNSSNVVHKQPVMFPEMQPERLLHDDWNANFRKFHKFRKLKDQFNTCVSCAGEPYQNSGDV
jgi:hypothetical protein